MMNVRDLIRLLADFPADAEVMTLDFDGDQDPLPLEKSDVNYNHDENKVILDA